MLGSTVVRDTIKQSKQGIIAPIASSWVKVGYLACDRRHDRTAVVLYDVFGRCPVCARRLSMLRRLFVQDFLVG